jgi:hypothetical protein
MRASSSAALDPAARAHRLRRDSRTSAPQERRGGERLRPRDRSGRRSLRVDAVELGLQEHVESSDDGGEVRWLGDGRRSPVTVGARAVEASARSVRSPAPPHAPPRRCAAGEGGAVPARRASAWTGAARSTRRSSTGVRSATSPKRALPGVKVVMTTELVATDGGTRVRVRAKPAKERSRLAGLATGRARRKLLERSYARLGDLLASESSCWSRQDSSRKLQVRGPRSGNLVLRGHARAFRSPTPRDHAGGRGCPVRSGWRHPLLRVG